MVSGVQGREEARAAAQSCGFLQIAFRLRKNSTFAIWGTPLRGALAPNTMLVPAGTTLSCAVIIVRTGDCENRGC
jgi:hypothetical protein